MVLEAIQLLLIWVLSLLLLDFLLAVPSEVLSLHLKVAIILLVILLLQVVFMLVAKDLLAYYLL